MNPLKFLRKKTNNFFKSIDTITTKLLTLVLFVMTIPLMAVGNFSTDIINQSMADSSVKQLNLNKKIFDQKCSEEANKLKFLTQNALERIISDKSSEKEVFKKIQKKYNLDFCAVITKNRNFTVNAGNLTKKEILSNFNKIINVAFSGKTVSSTESTSNNLYKIVILPIFTGTGKVSSVLLTGKSFNKIAIPQEIKNLTGSTVAVYKIKNNKALIVNSNNIVFSPSSKLLKSAYFDGIQLQNPAEINSIIPVKNYFNEVTGNVYIGLSKNEFPVDKNRESIGIIAVISLLSAMSIAGWFARTITNPVLSLVDAAKSIASGDLEHQVKIKGNDETAQLAKTFNRMSSNLKRQEHLRDNFVATLTHDLKVPMLAENQTVTYLLKGAYGEISEEQREVLELIKSTNNSSLEMIGTLLDVYRYDSGNVRLFESEFDIPELLKDSVNQIKSLADEKKIQINISCNKDTVLVNADQREIKRVLHNLISNAINNGIHGGFINCSIEAVKEKRLYQPKTGPESYTTLAKTLDLAGCVILNIEDNGIGIAKADMPLLFQRFSLSKGRKPAGAGLGLYYSSQVILRHQGDIWAESSDKGGSSFKFTLPVQSG